MRVVTRSSTWRSWVTSTSPPRNSARRSSSHAMPSMSRWFVGSSSTQQVGVARVRRACGPTRPAWPAHPTASPGRRRPALPCRDGRAPRPPPTPRRPRRSPDRRAARASGRARRCARHARAGPCPTRAPPRPSGCSAGWTCPSRSGRRSRAGRRRRG